MRIQLAQKLLFWIIIITFSFTGVTPAFSGGRIIPDGKVRVYEGETLVQVLKQEAPFPEGALLTTEGNCGVRLADFYLVANDGCTFGIVDGLNRINLRVDSGLLYFAITQKTEQLTFLTPAGLMVTQQVRLNAASDGGVLKGYLDVNDSHVQLGVLEGGTMVVSTDKGNQEARSGKQITLALADPISEDDKKKMAAKGQTPAAQGAATTGTATTGAALGGAAAAIGEIPAVFIDGGAVLLGAASYAVFDANRPTGSGPASPVAP
jgi:hypothetical protein